jgi:hypothetical protein
MDVHLCADELETARVYHVSAYVSAYACCCSSSMQEHQTCSSAAMRCEPPFKHNIFSILPKLFSSMMHGGTRASSDSKSISDESLQVGSSWFKLLT